MGQASLDYASKMINQDLTSQRRRGAGMTVGMIILIVLVNVALAVTAIVERSGVWMTLVEFGIAQFTNIGLAVIAMVLMPFIWKRRGWRHALVHAFVCLTLAAAAPKLVFLVIDKYWKVG